MTFLENSPWLVNTLEEFLYYCCPECDERDNSKDSFIQHAYEHHPEAKEALEMVIGVKIELPDVKLEDEEYSNDDEPLATKKNEIQNNVKIMNDKKMTRIRCGLCNIEVSKHNLKRHMQNKHENLQKDILDKEKFMVDVKLPLKSLFELKEEDFIDDQNISHSDISLNCETNTDILAKNHKINEDPLEIKEVNSFNIDSDDDLDDDDNDNNDYDYKPNKSGPKKKKKLKNSNKTIEPKYQCSICMRGFSTSTQYKAHMKYEMATKRQLYKCEPCEKIFLKEITLKRHHMSVHEGNNNWRCDICNKTYITHVKLRRHIRLIHTDKKLNLCCKYCNDVFQNARILKEHINSAHKPQVPCELCSKTFHSLSSLEIHLREEHKEKTCDICGHIYKNLANLRNHKISDHGIEIDAPKFICDDCGKVFSSRGSLKHHKYESHRTLPELKCSQCPKVFIGKKSLSSHIKSVHGKLPCQICGKLFGEQRLKYHMISVHTEDHLKPFVCKLCGKGFEYNKKLKTHMNIHTGAKPHKCKYCNRGFSDPANAYAHEKTVHEGQKRSNKLK